MNLSNHIEVIGRLNNVQIVKTDGLTNFGQRAMHGYNVRLISIGANMDEREYWIALHELGHLLGEQPGDPIGNELGAWMWACTNSRMPMSDTSVELITEALGSYLRNRPAGHEKAWAWLSKLKSRSALKLAGPAGRLP